MNVANIIRESLAAGNRPKYEPVDNSLQLRAQTPDGERFIPLTDAHGAPTAEGLIYLRLSRAFHLPRLLVVWRKGTFVPPGSRITMARDINGVARPLKSWNPARQQYTQTVYGDDYYKNFHDEFTVNLPVIMIGVNPANGSTFIVPGSHDMYLPITDDRLTSSMPPTWAARGSWASTWPMRPWRPRRRF